MRIIPNIPVQIKIENTPRQEFNRRDDQSAEQRAEKQVVMGESSVGQINEAQTNTAAKRHGPMGVSAEGDLD